MESWNRSKGVLEKLWKEFHGYLFWTILVMSGKWHECVLVLLCNG